MPCACKARNRMSTSVFRTRVDLDFTHVLQPQVRSCVQKHHSKPEEVFASLHAHHQRCLPKNLYHASAAAALPGHCPSRASAFLTFLALTSAPSSISVAAATLFSPTTVSINGVVPHRSCTLRSAPFLASNRTMSRLATRLAQWRGVQPSR